MRHNGPVTPSRPRTPLFTPGSIVRKRPPATPARLAVGAALFGLCAWVLRRGLRRLEVAGG